MTKLQGTYAKVLVALLFTLSVVFTQTAAYAAQPIGIVSQADGAAEYKQFIQEKFKVSLNGTVTKGQFIEAVAKILNYKPSGKEVIFSDLKSNDVLFPSAAALYENGILQGPDIQAGQPLSNIAAASIAVRAAGLKELAYTYPTNKVTHALKLINQSN
jgi:hypothetical protein